MKNLMAVKKIVEAQKFLKSKYSIEKYNETITYLLSKSNGDVRILIGIAHDKENTAELRLFAAAALGAAYDTGALVQL